VAVAARENQFPSNRPVTIAQPPLVRCANSRRTGWEGDDANLRRQIDPQVFGLYGFAKADAQTTLPTNEVPANIKNIKLLGEAYHSL